jgi:hypothetical protein
VVLLFLKSQLNSDCTTELLAFGGEQPEQQNLCLAVICNLMYYGGMGISVALLLRSTEFDFCAD